jgi:hypothetical protein
MKFRYLLLLFAFAGCIYSCKKDNNSPQSLIVGKWTLQQEHVVQYTDSVQKVDTVYSASVHTTAYIQFNSDKTYTTQSNYLPDNYLQSLGSPAYSSKGSGTYNYSNNVLTVSFGVADWFAYLVGSSGPITPATNIVQLTGLSATTLDIHTVNSFNYTNQGTHNFKVVSDLHYTKQTSL